MQTRNITTELIEFMEKKGVIDGLQEAKQLENEADRLGLVDEISELRRIEAKKLPPALEKLRQATAAKAAAESALEIARIEIMQAEQAVRDADAGFRVEKRLGALAKLADKRLHRALVLLRDFETMARQKGFRSWRSSERAWDLIRKIRTEHSNNDEVQSVCQAIRQSSLELQNLLYEPRPGNLQEIISARLAAAEAACRGFGVAVLVPDQTAGAVH